MLTVCSCRRSRAAPATRFGRSRVSARRIVPPVSSAKSRSAPAFPRLIWPSWCENSPRPALSTPSGVTRAGCSSHVCRKKSRCWNSRRAIDGPQDFDRCLIGLEACSDARACPAHAFWKKTREDIRDTLRRTTLAEVIEFEARKRQATKSKPAGEAKALSSRFSLNPARNP